jgi:intracellular sulfur oxidation DsrE/DsrF family protein
MEQELTNERSPRRDFLGWLTGGAAALVGLAAIGTPLDLMAQAKAGGQKAPAKTQKSPADLWFDKLHGTHRVVYDAPRTHEIMPFVWPKVFLLTNESTGTPATDCGVVVVLRHEAIAYAFQDEMWAKYGFAEVFKATELGGAFQAADAATATKTRNPVWKTTPGDFKVPGFGAVDIGIKDLQASGVMFCVCQAAMTVYSSAVAGKMSVEPAVVLKDWTDHLIPGIQPVPSGVWALGRAQEHKCAYIFAG